MNCDAAGRRSDDRRRQLGIATEVDTGGAEEPGQARLGVVQLVRCLEHRGHPVDERRRLGDDGVEPLVDRRLHLFVDGGEELELRREVVVDGAGRHAGAVGEQLVRRRRVALLGERIAGGVHDPLARGAGLGGRRTAQATRHAPTVARRHRASTTRVGLGSTAY